MSERYLTLYGSSVYDLALLLDVWGVPDILRFFDEFICICRYSQAIFNALCVCACALHAHLVK